MVVLVYDVVLVAGNVVFCPVNRNSYCLRANMFGWRYVVVWDAGSVVRVMVVLVVVVVGSVGSFVDIGSIWCVLVGYGW